MDLSKIKDAIGTIALGNYLSEWDEAVSYEDIMEILTDARAWDDNRIYRQGDLLVNVWAKFEDEEPSFVATHIDNLYVELLELVQIVSTNLIEAFKDGERDDKALTEIANLIKNIGE
jgi:hypothetical protein